MTRSSRFVVPLLVTVLLGATLGASGCGKSQGKTLATTGSRRLTVEQFEEYARDPQVMQPYGALPESAQKKALFDDLLSYEVLAEAGARAGFDKDSVYTKIEEQALPRILPDALYDKHIGNTIAVSETEAKLFYEAPKEEHRLAVIMVPDAQTGDAALKRLAGGDKFTEVAKAMSMDPGAAQSGGEIPGWITLNQLPPAIETAVAPLKPGGHTAVIAQRAGTYIFGLLESRPRTAPVPFEQNKAEIVKSLENRKKGALIDDYLMKLKAKYGLKVEGPGWAVVSEKMLLLPDSLARFLGSDPKRAGMTDADLGQTVATWTGKTYTVRDLAKDIDETPLNERPPSSNVALVKLFVDGKAMNEIMVAEAKKEGLADSPKVRRQIDRAKSSYLVNKYVEKTLPAGAVPYPTQAVLDSVTRVMVSQAGQGAPPNLSFSMLPPQLQQQVVAEWQTKHRQALLKAEVDRLKLELKPVIDDKALQSIPWPVPAEADNKEKA
jgi:parvulin-like peptidyl-prolyl isomerase